MHWTDPDNVTYDVVPLASYPSQTSPLADDVEPVLPGEVLAWPYECVIHA